MTKTEYQKYNNFEAYDMRSRPIRVGDTVVFNNHYGTAPNIGVVSHFTQSGKLAIVYNWYNWKGIVMKYNAYRESRTVVKIKSGNRK